MADWPVHPFEVEWGRYGSDVTFTTLPNPTPAYWYKNGAKIKQGVKVPTLSWGTLTLASTEGAVTCSTVGAGHIENPVGGGTGLDATEVLATLLCTDPGCPAVVEVKAEKLPWPSELMAVGNVVREKDTGIAVRVRCFKPATETEAEEVLSNVVYSGGLTPSMHSGSAAAKPSFAEFDAGSGELLSESGPAKAAGRAKVMGFAEQEVISAK